MNGSPDDRTEPVRVRALLRLLLGPYESAALLGRPARAFAVDLDLLSRTGLPEAALERLAAESYVEEVAAGPGRRFALTAAGAAVAREEGPGAAPGQEVPADVPHWEGGARKLTYRRHCVKQFARQAPGQFRVLKAFEDNHWAALIENPFGSDRAAGKLLNSAVKGLNRRLKNSLLRFEVEDKGKRVRWVAVRRTRRRRG
jgi:hypothetical protein